jgi:hypothetical protein
MEVIPTQDMLGRHLPLIEGQCFRWRNFPQSLDEKFVGVASLDITSLVVSLGSRIQLVRSTNNPRRSTIPFFELQL